MRFSEQRVRDEAITRAAAVWGVPPEAVDFAWYRLEVTGYRYAKVARELHAMGQMVGRRQLRYLHRKVIFLVDLRGRHPANYGEVLRNRT